MSAAPGWVLLLESILRQSVSLPNALCRDRQHARLFDGDTDDDVEAAKTICRRCGDIQHCREWASAIPARKLSGVVAGELREWYSHESLRKPQRRGRPPKVVTL